VTAPEDPGYLIPVEQLDRSIVEIRGKRVILGHDLAAAYGVTTKRLNEQVSRNATRFPSDFMFQLTWEEAEVLRSRFATSNEVGSRSQFATLKRGRNIKYRPYAFTEHGAVMAASVLNSDRAVEVSVFVVRAFVRMSRMLASHRQLALKLAELEARVSTHDRSIQSLLAAIRSLITPPEPKKKRSGSSPTTTNPARPAEVRTSSLATDLPGSAAAADRQPQTGSASPLTPDPQTLTPDIETAKLAKPALSEAEGTAKSGVGQSAIYNLHFDI